MISIRIPFLLLLFILEILLISAQNNNDENAKIPAQLLAKALNHVARSGSGNPNAASSTLESLHNGNVDALYDVAKSMNGAGEDERLTSILIWHELADGPARHILSMVKLGETYSEQDKAKAMRYFVQAGEDGPHQASLYNAGRLFVEAEDYARGLAYVRAAATLGNDKERAVYARPKMTATATEAYHDLSKMMQRVDMDFQTMVDIFPYASFDGFPKDGSKDDKLWNNSMKQLQEFAKSRKHQFLEAARRDLSKLQDSKGLSKLQEVLLQRIQAATLEMIKDEL